MIDLHTQILETWQGRSIHFHWVMYPDDDDLFGTLSRMYQDALFIDYEALTARQESLIESLKNSTVHIRKPTENPSTT